MAILNTDFRYFFFRLSAGYFLGVFAYCCSHSAQAVNVNPDSSPPYGYIGAPVVYPSPANDGTGRVYETRFDAENFSGDVVAREIDRQGSILQDEFNSNGLLVADNAIWRAHENLPSPDNRIVFSSGYPFRWHLLPDWFQNALESHPGMAGKGGSLVDWIRGEETLEGAVSGDFRIRRITDSEGGSVHQPLGGFIHSAIQYAGPPSRIAAGEGYAEFLDQNRNRVHVVYAGANDGMLHGFSAETGQELFAYIPEAVAENLAALGDQHYSQQYYVDGSPLIADAYAPFPACFMEFCWRTVLVGGLNSGGKSVYALDVTEPEPASEVNAATDMFLWEFRHADLGYSYSRPVIAKLYDGRWVAIFGNGIPDREGVAAALFIVNISDGSLIQKLDLPGESLINGLQSVTAFDSDFDGCVDYVYAGDTDGNLWKFDFTERERGEDEIEPEVEARIFHRDGPQNSPAPFATVSGQNSQGESTHLVIQTPPVITRTDLGETLVIFGTGRLFNVADATQDYGDSLFGIYDDPDNTTGLGKYPDDFELHSRILSTVAGEEGTPDVRIVEDDDLPANAAGWVLKLDTGERILGDLLLTSKRVTFSSYDPLSEDGTNWFTSVDYETGGVPEEQFLDTNGDDKIDGLDLAGDEVPVSLELGSGLVSNPWQVTLPDGTEINLLTGQARDKNGKGNPDNPDQDEDGAGDGESENEAREGVVQQYPPGETISHGVRVNSSALPTSRVSWREVTE